MAAATREKRKVPGRPFQKGQSGNPKGRSEKQRRDGRITKAVQATEREVALRYIWATDDEFAALLESPTVTKIERGYAAVVEAMCRGDIAAFKAVMERTYGKPRESIELTGAGGGPVRHAELTLDEMLAEVRALEQVQRELDGK